MSSLFEIENVNFRFYTDEEFKRTAAVQITEEMTFDSLNTPVRGGLYDPRMGPLDNFSNCETCSLSEKMCPGHMGYIQLEYPAYHPRMRPELRKVLLGSCIYCQRLKIKPQRRFFYMKRFELVRAGLFTVSRQLEECPDAFFGDLQEHHLANLFRSRTGPQNRKKDGEDENEEEEEAAEKTSFISHHESRNPYLLTDTELEAIDNVVNKLIIAEAKKNGYSEAKLDAFFESVVSDVHAPVHHERLLIAREFFAEISGRCPFCASLHSSWTSPDKSGNKLYCNVPKSSKPPRLDDTSHLALQRIIRAVYGQVETAERESLYAPDLSRPIYMFPQEVFNFVAAVWKNDSDVFDYIYNSPGSDKLTHNHLFMNIVPVPPNRYRSPMKRSGAFFEHDLNYLFRQVVFLTKSIKRDKQALVGDLISDTIFSRVNDAQRIVNDLFDFDDNAQALHKRVIFGYKQVIEKKEGLMRTNMMGKRVNFSARSVILPDPMIHTDEVSVPLVFAKKLSFPEVVNDLNLARLRQSILNGPDVYPGANALKVDGKIFHFKTLPYFRRKAMSQVLQKGNTVVMRHIKDGDMFLVNRQPSLHRVSMMAHKARVLSNNYQKTIRIHYANCKSYNADFDGDEMNLHIPQDLVSQSEARELVKNSNQYCSPTSGEPIRGLIQDHIVSGVLLTLKDTFFDRETYQSLVFGSIFHRVGDHRIETVPPCIIKPRPLWSGKQVVTTILKDIAAKRAGINLDCGAKLKNCWGDHKEEETVIIRDNEVMTGIFDKNQIGSSEFGIVHAFDEVYGHDASAELLTCFTRLTTLFLQYHGFTCGVDDLMVTDDCNENRSKIMKAADSDARHATAEFAKQKRLADSKLYDQNSIIKNMSSLLVNDRNRRKLDAEVKKALSKHTSKLISESIPRGLMKPFPANNMTLMTQSGAKGSLVNASQISCCLGLQEFEGRRVRPTVSGKTLPSFEVYDTSAISGGYVASRFLTGIKPQEYFFHCMAGRDGLIDTAVKTARSGYLQRCLVKALEDLTVKYDGTVRNESNTVVQFKYGGDSIDPLKSSFLHNSKFAAMNHKAVAEKYRLSEDEEHTDKSVLKYKGSDPVASVYDPWRVKGAVSDKFARNLSEYIESNPDGLVLASKKRKDALLSDIHVSLDKFKSISNERFMRSLVNPGEAVGVIAAQSIGEPSTQMTLNTFHFAGLDVAHVTVGIPRLIELFMIGQTKTVLTTLPVKSVHKNEMIVKKFAASMSSVTFGDALEYVDIIEKIGYNPNTNERERSISLNIKFDLEEFSKYYGISVDQFWETVKAILIRNIVLTIKQYLMHGRFKSRIALAGVTKQRVIDVNQKTKQATFLSNSDFKDAGENAEASVMGDNQSTSTKSTKKQTKKKKADEESDGEDEMESDSEDEQSDDDEEEESEDEGEEQAEEQDAKKKKKSTPKESKDDLAIEQSPFYKSFDIQRKEGILTIELNDGVKDHRIFLKDVVHKVCQSTYLRTYTGIEKVNVIQQRQGEFELQMEGFNIEELLMTRQAAEFIDFNSIITNDIRATAATYGIEAAYQLLVNEMKNVFKLYGIPVDERHICLIAEHMTNTGEYRACNRASMVSSPGVFHKATFESSLTFLGNSTAYAEIDQVRGPSAELILGKTVSQGTGSFDILIPEVKCN